MKYSLSITLLLTLLTSVNSQAADPHAGKKQVDDNCYACHGNEVYTRDNRMVNTRPGLSAQVQRCQLALNLNWFEDEVENAANYLNQQFYHLK